MSDGKAGGGAEVAEDTPLVEAMGRLAIDNFTPTNPASLLPDFADGKTLYVRYKENKPLNYLIEYGKRRANGFATEGYLQKRAVFHKSDSESGNVSRLQERGLFVLIVDPLQRTEAIHVFAYRGNVNSYLREVGNETFINVYITMANFAS
eukprot:g2038.t1